MMIRCTRITLTLLCMLTVACLSGTAAATSLGTIWTDNPYTGAPFTDVTFTKNDSFVLAGGDQMLFRSWTGDLRWGGRAGTHSAMTGDGRYIVTALGNAIVLYDNKGHDMWSRSMDGQVRGVAIAKDGSLVVSIDDKGNYNTWAFNGEFVGRNTSDLVKKVAVSPKDNMIVVTTEAGMRFFTPVLSPVWVDNRSGSLDELIAISDDGSTIITAGGTRLSSHTSTGRLNWMADVSENAIIDMACNYDCSVIVVGSQDSNVQAIDRYGKSHWKFRTGGQWAKAVGVSDDGSIIAAGSNDGTVYVLTRSGSLLTQKKMDDSIQSRALAVSHGGDRIVVADAKKLYGLDVLGDDVPGVMETFTPQPLNPVKRTTTPATLVPATVVETESPQETPAPPTETPTRKSPAGVLLVPGALTAAALLMMRRK